jgi:hypothetical protein
MTPAKVKFGTEEKFVLFFRVATTPIKTAILPVKMTPLVMLFTW